MPSRCLPSLSHCGNLSLGRVEQLASSDMSEFDITSPAHQASLQPRAQPLLAVTYAGVLVYSAILAAGLLVAPRQVSCVIFRDLQGLLSFLTPLSIGLRGITEHVHDTSAHLVFPSAAALTKSGILLEALQDMVSGGLVAVAMSSFILMDGARLGRLRTVPYFRICQGLSLSATASLGAIVSSLTTLGATTGVVMLLLVAGTVASTLPQWQQQPPSKYLERGLLAPRSAHGMLYGAALVAFLVGGLTVLAAPQQTLARTFGHTPAEQELLAWKVVGASLLLPVWLCVPLKVAADKHEEAVHARAVNLTLFSMGGIQLFGLVRAAMAGMAGPGLKVFVAAWTCGIVAALFGIAKTLFKSGRYAVNKKEL